MLFNKLQNWKSLNTWYAHIYLAGDIEIAKQVCREECMKEGLCITIEPCEYIYTGGQETGYKIGLINYPKYPNNEEYITERAKRIAINLIKRTCQLSALVVTPSDTMHITSKEKK